MWKELEMEINGVGPADVRINIYEKCRGGSISVLILIGVTIAYTRIRNTFEGICTSVSTLSSVLLGS